MTERPIPNPPKSDAEYEKARLRCLENYFGNQIIQCNGCRWPRLNGYVCQRCGDGT
jgi:hypothetical protein